MILAIASFDMHCGHFQYAQASMDCYMRRLHLGDLQHLKPYFIICGRVLLLWYFGTFLTNFVVCGMVCFQAAV